MSKGRENTSGLVKQQNLLLPHHISRVRDLSGPQDKDLGTLFLLAALSRSGSRVYKQRNSKHLGQLSSYNFHQSELGDQRLLPVVYHCQLKYNVSVFAEPVKFICSFHCYEQS